MGRNGIQGSYTDVIVLSPATPKTTGGNLNLANGQIGLFRDAPSNDGKPAVTNVNLIRNARLSLEVGSPINSNAGGYSSHNLSSVPFLAKDVLSLSHEESQASQVAKVYLGWDGLASTKTTKGIRLAKGEVSTITIRLTGEPIGHLGFSDSVYQHTFTIGTEPSKACDADPCEDEPCSNYLLPVIAQMKNTQVRPDVNLDQLIKIIPVQDCFVDPTPSSTVQFFTLTLCDGGDDLSLAIVQAQFPASEVVRVSYAGNESTYQIYLPAASGTPADFVAPVKTIKTDCDGDCPVGFTSVGGGFVYNVTLEDDGTDLSSTLLDTVTGVADTASALATVTVGAADALRTAGTYTVNSFTTSGSGTGAIFSVVVNGSGAATVTIVSKGTGFAVANTITIADGSLGGGGAANLVLTVASLVSNVASVTKIGQLAGQGQYVVVSSSALSTNSLQDLVTERPTLTYEALGESTAVCVEDSPAEVSWVAGEECNVITKNFYIELSDTDCGTNRLAELQAAYPSLTIAVDNTGATDCRRRYTTSVVSNFVCDSCHTDQYKVDAPSKFEFELWKEVVSLTPAADGCACGIYFEALEFTQCPSKELSDDIATRVGQIRIEVSGGETPEFLPVGYSTYTGQPFAVTHVQRPFDGTGWGFQYMQAEKETIKRLSGVKSGETYSERWFKGTTTKLEPCEQYDSVSVVVANEKSLGGFANKQRIEHRYVFIIPKGTLSVYKPFFNSVAAGNPDAGVI